MLFNASKTFRRAGSSTDMRIYQPGCLTMILTSQPDLNGNQKDKRSFDACVIRTHASEEISLAGLRVNHSAKAP